MIFSPWYGSAPDCWTLLRAAIEIKYAYESRGCTNVTAEYDADAMAINVSLCLCPPANITSMTMNLLHEEKKP